MLAFSMHCPQQKVLQLHFFPQRHCGIIRRKICVTATAMSSHTHENKQTKGVFQKLLWDGELKYTLPIQPPELCCVTGTLHSCSKGDQENLVYVHLLHLPCLKVRLHNPDWFFCWENSNAKQKPQQVIQQYQFTIIKKLSVTSVRNVLICFFIKNKTECCILYFSDTARIIQAR